LTKVRFCSRFTPSVTLTVSTGESAQNKRRTQRA
jgi:hypothetical protein